jgi:hypothetical protein
VSALPGTIRIRYTLAQTDKEKAAASSNGRWR